MSQGGEIAPKVVVDDRFELVERLADRGVGEVWKARNLNLNKQLVSLKFLREAETEGDMPEGLDAMVRRLRKLEHPNLLRTTGSGLWGARPYLVQGWFEGVTLTAAMDAARAKHPLVPLASLEKLVDQVCAALEALHAADLVHGELHPGCVLVQATAGGQFDVRVIDAGIGAFAEGGTAFIYADCVAPERAEGRPLHPTADVYSLAMVMRRVLCEVSETRPWVAPFAGDYRGREDVPAAVWEVMARAAWAEAGGRYASVTELRSALREAWRSTARLEVKRAGAEAGKDVVRAEKDAMPRLYEMVERAVVRPAEVRVGMGGQGDVAGAALLEGLLGKLPKPPTQSAGNVGGAKAKGANPWATDVIHDDSTFPMEFLALPDEGHRGCAEEHTLQREQVTEMQTRGGDDGSTEVQTRKVEVRSVDEIVQSRGLADAPGNAVENPVATQVHNGQMVGSMTTRSSWRLVGAITALVLLCIFVLVSISK